MIEISKTDFNAILNHAKHAHPEECCGMFTGDGQKVQALYPSDNISAQDKTRTFEVNPKVRFQIIRETGERSVMGIYHSHPNGVPYPSQTDRSMVYEPDLIWIIATLTELKAFRFITTKQDFEEIEIKVRL